jgi:ADP-heptose:LPS heptosyltransferase
LRRAGVMHVVAADPAPPPRRHIADHLVATLGLPGIDPLLTSENSGDRLQVLSIGSATDADGAVGTDSTPGLLIHPGSGAERKNWPAPSFAALINQLAERGWGISLLCGPADSDAVSAVLAELAPARIPTITPGGLTELGNLLLRAGAYVGNDSGVTHLSARLGVPTVALFGPTDPRQWAPRGPRVSVLHGVPWPAVPAVVRSVDRLRVITRRAAPP